MGIRLLKGLAVLLCSLFVLWGVGELLCRGLDIAPRPLHPLNVDNYIISTNPLLLFEYKADFQRGDPRDRSDLEGFSTNSDGMRDHEYTVAKPENTIRILALGDSITAGTLIAEGGGLYPKRLEQGLREFSSGEQYQVLNMGVGGYHTLQEVELLRVKGLKYDPDYVLVGFCLNDFYPESDGGIYQLLLESNYYTEPACSGPSLFQSILGCSRFAFVLYHRLAALFPPDKDSLYKAYEEKHLQGKTTVEAGFSLLHQLQKEHGFKALVFIIPVFQENLADYPFHHCHDLVVKTAEPYPEITVIDLFEDFQKLGNDSTIYAWDEILHPNLKGHEVIAGRLIKEIRERWLSCEVDNK